MVRIHIGIYLLYNHISTYYDVNDNVEMFIYIQKVAYVRFNQWMSDCKAHFETFGPYVPVDFVERVDEWTWLMAHWSTKESKVRSKRMKEARAPEKVDHNSSSTPFAYRANKLKESGNKAPILNTSVEGYKKNAPEVALSFYRLLQSLKSQVPQAARTRSHWNRSVSLLRYRLVLLGERLFREGRSSQFGDRVQKGPTTKGRHANDGSVV